MGIVSYIRDLSSNIPLPSAAELDAAHFESYSPYPEFNHYHSRDGASMASMLASKLFKNDKDGMLPISQETEKARQSSDLESNASTDASTLLDDPISMPQKDSASAASAARVVSDAIIGLSDGLTVPFALTAGLSALGDTRLVIYGGVAELIAGAISMGLGGYLAAKSEE